MLGEDGTCDVTRAYVCLEDEGRALTAALALHAAPDAVSVPVVATVADASAGVAVALQREDGRAANITAFGLLTEATSPELLLRGTTEILARAKHEQYLRDGVARGDTIESYPNMCAWEELTEDSREDNRKFVDGIGEKLRQAGCMLVPMSLRDPDEPLFEFDDEEMELLARGEHDRWMRAKLEDGWRFGSPRDDARKLHDKMVPWEQLSESDRDRDREPIRELPAMLDLTGYRIRRAGTRVRTRAADPVTRGGTGSADGAQVRVP